MPKTIEVYGNLKLGGSEAYIGVTATPLPVFDDPWTPDLISPLLWFDADSGITLNGGSVSSWKSRTGSYTATQINSSKAPVYQPGINGLNTVKFDGIDDFLSVPHNIALNLPANQNFEIFSVSQTDNVYGPEARPVIVGKGTASNGYLLYVSVTTGAANTIENPNHKYRFYMQGANVAIAPNNQGTGASLGWVRRQGNNGGIYNTIGGANTLGNVGIRNGSPNAPLSLGAANNGLERFMQGQIGEVILVKRALNPEERQKMEGYLAHKWGMETDLPDGHPYRDRIPMVNDDPNAMARLIVHGNIVQNIGSTNLINNGVKLYDQTDSTFVELILTGVGQHQYDLQNGPKARLWKISMDKDEEPDHSLSSFAFNGQVEINGPANEFVKPVTIKNGLLKFNDPDIDITLSSGGGDFVIPAKGGLEINAGDLKITGFQTGLLHSGLLKITGGSLVLGDTVGSVNYIEYASAGTPKIEIAGGSLTVGSQIRRGLSSTAGTLDYQQSGGDVIIGKFSAPYPTRAMLEVVGTGSSFEHTGGTLRFVQGINTGLSPSLLLTPSNHNVGGTAEIIIANADSPVGQHIQNFGIQSSIPLNSLSINSNNAPQVHLISNNLELKGNLTVHSGATIDGAGWNLTLNGNLTNDGYLSFATPGSGMTNVVNLVHTISGTVSGSGIFNLMHLNRTGSTGTTLVETNLHVKGDFTNDTGEMDFGDNSITVLGNVTSNGKLTFDEGTGLVLAGTVEQEIKCSNSGNTEIDILTIRNSSSVGVTSPPDFLLFKINKNFRLEGGKFSLFGNTLEMAQDAVFTPIRPYGENNMIITGQSAVNAGVLLNFPPNFKEDVFVPLGIDRFMPINLDFSQPGYSSGSAASSYRLQLSVPDNGTALDTNNVLGMFFSVDGTGIRNNLNMDMRFYYHNQYVRTQGHVEEDYIGAHTRGTDVWKYSDIVDTDANTITFHHAGSFEVGNETAVDGDYFAGVDAAIPANIKVYKTFKDGSVQDSIYTPPVPGGGAPSGAIVKIEHNVIVNVDNINFYQTVIDSANSGKVLTINARDRHRFGRVSGKGTIKLVNTGTLPSGNYTDFFGCDGGKIDFQAGEFYEYEILANMPPIEAVTLSGKGSVTIASSAVNVCKNLRVNGTGSYLSVSAANSNTLTIGENLIVEGGTLDLRQGNAFVQGDVIVKNTQYNTGKLSAGNNGRLTIEGDLRLEGSVNTKLGLGTAFRETHLKGNLIRTGATGVHDGTDGAKVVFDGTSQQTIQGEFTGATKIPSIELDNDDGLLLNGNLEVSEKLMLTEGNIFTDGLNMLSLSADNVEIVPAGGQSSSFVNGPMQWNLAGNNEKRTFPIGKNDRFRPLSLEDRSDTRTWEVEYYDTLGLIQPLVTSMDPDPSNVPTIVGVSKQEHWRVNSNTTSPTTAKVRLSWGVNSAVSLDPLDYSRLLVLGYNKLTKQWDSYGGDDFTLNKNFLSDTLVTFSERFLTIGSSDPLNPLPVTWLYFNGENKGEDNILSWATASEKNNDYFELERSNDAQNWTAIAQIIAAGYSTTKQAYSYTDYDAPFGRVYYRLKQVDFDGKMDYAPNVVSLERGFTKESEKFDFLLYPNPTQIGSVRFRMSSMSDVQANVSIYDLSGKFLSQSYVQVDGQGTSAPIDCNLEPGIYLVTVIVNDKMRSKPLVITR